MATTYNYCKGGDGMEYTHIELTKQFWDGKKDGKEYFLDKDGIEVALWRALKDFTPRTEKRKTGSTEKLGVDEMLSKLGERYIKNFVEFFDNDDNSKINLKKFDNWHNKMCDEFLKTFNRYYESLAYGKAQKIVNMTFKGIYCLKGAEQKEEYFKYCHMPLDSLTLEWFKRNCKINGKAITKGKVLPWSKLEYATNKNKDKYSYPEIMKSIREFFKNGTGWTPLKAEFLIWPQIQLELAAEGLVSELSKLDDSINLKEFKKKSTQEKISVLKEKLKSINSEFIYGDVSKNIKQ